jgi:methylmalonyl-CoA mutase N-terminal domain/subunit
MCIYCGTNKYRKIYENHNGKIPKDESGHSYHIHHIDGNHKNNLFTNLMVVSAKEHYNIHYSQGDYGACLRMSSRLGISPNEISRLSSLNQQKRVEQKIHTFQRRVDGSSFTKDRMLTSGYNNPWSTRENGTNVTSDRYANGWKSPLCKREDGSSVSSDRIKNSNYINPWKKRSDGSSAAKDQRKNPKYKEVFATREDGTSIASDMLAQGRHPSQVVWECICGKSGKGKGNFTRFHSTCFDKPPS